MTKPTRPGENALTALFLGLLALAWLGVFAPAVLRARQNTPLSSSARFRHSMRMISPRGGRSVVLPAGDRRPSTSYRRALIEGRRMARRRRNALFLLLCALLTGASAALGGPAGIELHLVADGALATYLAFLVEARRQRAERAMKVHRLDKMRNNRRMSDFAFNEPTPARRRA